MSDTVRAFIAIKLPEEVISFLTEFQAALKAYKLKVRWVKPANIHLTLKFIGNIQPEEVAKIAGAMAATAEDHSPFLLSAKGLGVFPGIRRPRVIWVGLAGQTRRLVDLQQQLENRLDTIGYPKETRPYRNHLTLGRTKGPVDADRMTRLLQEYADSASEAFRAKEIILFRSDLKPTGAVYTALQRVPL